jgi:hypothetical protein
MHMRAIKRMRDKYISFFGELTWNHSLRFSATVK